MQDNNIRRGGVKSPWDLPVPFLAMPCESRIISKFKNKNKQLSKLLWPGTPQIVCAFNTVVEIISAIATENEYRGAVDLFPLQKNDHQRREATEILRLPIF